MRMKWMSIGAAALLLMAGCGKSGNNATTAPNQEAAGQSSASAQNPSQQANGGNAATAPATTPSAAPTPPPPPKPFEVAAGTSLPVVLTTSLSSYKNKPGDEFDGSLAAPVMVDGEVAIPKGSAVHGTVVDAKKQGKFKGEALLSVRLTNITVRGKDYPITSSTYGATEKGKGKRTAVVTGGGAALGALIGGLAGGGKGAAIGAGVGGGAGLAGSGATGGQNVNLPAETRITFKLAQGITVER